METVVRVTIIYLFILVGLRVLGKREFGQLAPMELIVLLLIPEMVSQSISGEDFSVTNALIGVTTLFALVFINSALVQRSKPLEKLIQGTPAVLVANGAFIHRTMNQERVTPDEIYEAMHESGVETLKQVKWAILETNGRIAIVPADSQQVGQGAGNQDSTPIG